MRKPLALTLALMLLPAVALAQSGPSGWTAEVVTDDLDYPWDIAADGDRLFITEKAGQIVVMDGTRQNRQRIETSAPLRTDGGAGLLGMALAPDFATTGRAFFYYSYEDGSRPLNRVIEARLDGDLWQETAVLIDAIPGHRLYNGGRIAIGPDGHLYVTTGWTENYDLPQDTDSLAGKVLRVALDGAIPPDNPFAGSPVWSYGHRNPQGLGWSPEGELFVSEHGQSGNDEVNLIRAGQNYGWPEIEGDARRDGMEVPFAHSGSGSWVPSGLAFAGGDLLVATMRPGGLFTLDRSERVMAPAFASNERFRQVLSVGDALYVITTNRSPRGSGPSDDRLLRLRH